jgi:hypothetical protein
MFTLLLSIKRHFSQGILFYEGIIILIITTLAILIYIWKFHNNINSRIHDYYSIVISFFIILTFHTTVITIVDRSISVFIINNVNNGVYDSSLVKKNFINNFTNKGIDKRINEQIEIGNILSNNGELKLTWKGKFFHQSFNVIQTIFRTDKNILNKYSK